MTEFAERRAFPGELWGTERPLDLPLVTLSCFPDRVVFFQTAAWLGP